MPIQFRQSKLDFGALPSDGVDDCLGLPTPIKVQARLRRTAAIREAQEVLATLPGPCESIHFLCTARLDTTDIINMLIGHLGPINEMKLATLGYNDKNLMQILGWLDDGKVKTVSLLTSLFHRAHKRALYEQTRREFRDRGQLVSAAHSHAKVCAFAFADGVKMSIEGSANLCGNGSGREQFALINDAGVHDWHSAWIDAAIVRAEGKS